MTLNIAQMYPDFLNLYGDSGNITSLTKRCKWRDIDVVVKKYSLDEDVDFENIDIIYLGGGTDKSRAIVNEHLKKFSSSIKEYVEKNGVVLAVCSGFEMLGNYFMYADEKVEALKIIDMYTDYSADRFIGDVVIQTSLFDKPVVGFENHNGRVFIDNNIALGTVIYGNGNNGTDKNEGIIYKNVIGTYIHGPLLPKNPQLSDEIIKRALIRKYGSAELTPLDDTVEIAANNYICKRFCTND